MSEGLQSGALGCLNAVMAYPPIENSDLWRKRAEEARTMFERMLDAHTKVLMLGIAETYAAAPDGALFCVEGLLKITDQVAACGEPFAKPAFAGHFIRISLGVFGREEYSQNITGRE